MLACRDIRDGEGARGVGLGAKSGTVDSDVSARKAELCISINDSAKDRTTVAVASVGLGAEVGCRGGEGGEQDRECDWPVVQICLFLPGLHYDGRKNRALFGLDCVS